MEKGSDALASGSAFSASVIATSSVFFAVALGMVLFDIADGSGYLHDVDDTLRAIQIRHLLETGLWFDLSLPMIQMPEIYVSPWSRLVDLPYAAITILLTPVLGSQEALQFAFAAWPLVMLGIYCVICAGVVRNLAAGDPAAIRPITSVVIVLLMFKAIIDFSPGRIDHHNVQIILIMAMLWGASAWTRLGGWVSGVAGTASVAVGLECVPFVAVAFASTILMWVLGRRDARGVLVSQMLGAAISAPLLGLALIGPAAMTTTQCDAYSAPFILLLTALPLAVAAIATGTADTASPIWKTVFLAAAGATICVGLAMGFSECLAGPYHMIDPLSRELWLNRVHQEQSILRFFADGNWPVILLHLAWLVVAILAAPSLVERFRAGNPGALVVYFVAVVALATAFLQIRFNRFPAAFVPVLLPMALCWLQSVKLPSSGLWRGYRAPAAAVLLLAAMVTAIHQVAPERAKYFDAVAFMAFDTCREQDFGALALAAPGRLVAPYALAVEIAGKGVEGVSVAGIPFHRASPGLRRTLLAFTSGDPDARREALAPFDYVAVCRFPLLVKPEEAPLYAALANGGEWPGLVRIAAPVPTNLQLFRIDHDRLQ